MSKKPITLNNYIKSNYSIPLGELNTGCDATRGALQRFSNDIGVAYQTVQRWRDRGAVIVDGCVVRREVLHVFDNVKL